jgi:hypothetical protein
MSKIASHGPADVMDSFVRTSIQGAPAQVYD